MASISGRAAELMGIVFQIDGRKAALVDYGATESPRGARCGRP